MKQAHKPPHRKRKPPRPSPGPPFQWRPNNPTHPPRRSVHTAVYWDWSSDSECRSPHATSPSSSPPSTAPRIPRRRYRPHPSSSSRPPDSGLAAPRASCSSSPRSAPPPPPPPPPWPSRRPRASRPRSCARRQSRP